MHNAKESIALRLSRVARMYHKEGHIGRAPCHHNVPLDTRQVTFADWVARHASGTPANPDLAIGASLDGLVQTAHRRGAAGLRAAIRRWPRSTARTLASACLPNGGRVRRGDFDRRRRETEAMCNPPVHATMMLGDRKRWRLAYCRDCARRAGWYERGWVDTPAHDEPCYRCSPRAAMAWILEWRKRPVPDPNWLWQTLRRAREHRPEWGLFGMFAGAVVGLARASGDSVPLPFLANDIPPRTTTYAAHHAGHGDAAMYGHDKGAGTALLGALVDSDASPDEIAAYFARL